MLNENEKECLNLIGFLYQNGWDSKSILLLKSMLKAQEAKRASLTFSEIYEFFSKDDEGKRASKAWVHRLLKGLIESRIVDIESLSAKRNKYICDINTLSTGLTYLRNKAANEISNQIYDLERQREKLLHMDPISLAQKVHESITGSKKIPSSRFLKGLDEFHRITDETIYNAAKEGDVIRNSIANLGPFVQGYAERTARLFLMASKGVEVKYSVTIDSLKEEAIFGKDMNREYIGRAVRMLKKPEEEGQAGLHCRLNPGASKSHQFASLNNEIMALWISEYPPTAAWITRDFNADLIDDIINTFEEQWKQSKPINEALEALLKGQHMTGGNE